MSTKKQFLKPQKGSKKKPQLPETEDEYLDAGVKEEEGGEKWRAGDAAKSLRFFERAIHIYASGSEKHPRSFDLAFNRARLQYDITQQPRLLACQPKALVELLNTALESHRYALSLRMNHADILFNTAQVMVSLAEALIDTTVNVGGHDRASATPLLIDAITNLQQCVELQWGQLQEANSVIAAAARFRDPKAEMYTESDPPSSEIPAESDPGDQWVSVEETVSSATLLDTYLAEIHAWTTLVPLLDASGSLYRETVRRALKPLRESEHLPKTTEETVAYEQATFNIESVLADYGYRSRELSSDGYAKTVFDLWSASDKISSSGPGLCDFADALIMLSSTLSIDTNQATTQIRWQTLTKALECLAQANLNPGPADRIAINDRRGDAELLRARLAEPPFAFEQALKSKEVLIKNAEIYYIGAQKLAVAKGDIVSADNLLAKSLVTKCLLKGNMQEILDGLPGGDQAKIRSVINEMAEEGLIVL